MPHSTKYNTKPWYLFSKRLNDLQELKYFLNDGHYILLLLPVKPVGLWLGASYLQFKQQAPRVMIDQSAHLWILTDISRAKNNFTEILLIVCNSFWRKKEDLSTQNHLETIFACYQNVLVKKQPPHKRKAYRPVQSGSSSLIDGVFSFLQSNKEF